MNGIARYHTRFCLKSSNSTKHPNITQQSVNSSSRFYPFLTGDGTLLKSAASLKCCPFAINSFLEKILEEVVANQHYEFLEDYLNHSSWVQGCFGIKTAIVTFQMSCIRGKHNYCMLILPDHLAQG